MQDIFGSVRRSLVFRTSTANGDDGRFGGFVEKIGSSLRKSRVGLFSKPPVPALSPRTISKEDVSQIRWRRGELIGCGAFGRVYMGMNLDSGELLAIKQVLIAAHSASKETTQVNIRELEEEVKLLKNLSHPNIVRYLGTAREDDSLNILLEFVPGGSISSLLGKFGSFPEPVIIMYTKQLLLGLEYLHKNGIMHRDIKGANILVDNKGCIKLADFGASKKVVELATMTGAKSMKGTPYWMAPEVILQTGHSFSADIWSVGCTVIEMATGKPPWSQQYQEVAALFHIGTTKSHPPIPEHLSSEAKDFLLKCLQKEPDLRSSASDLLKHPFVTGEFQELRPGLRNSFMEKSGNKMATPGMDLKQSTTCTGFKDVGSRGSVRCSTVYPDNYSRRGSFWGSTRYDDDMCVMDDLDDDLVVGTSMKFNTVSTSVDCNKSFNPMCEPGDEWSYKYDERPLEISSPNLVSSQSIDGDAVCSEASGKDAMDFTFPCGTLTCEDDDEVTDTKIRAFLDEKALDLKKLQTPLYEEFLNTVNAAESPSAFETTPSEKVTNISNLPPKSKSPNQVPRRRLSSAVGSAKTTSHGSHLKRLSNIDGMSDRTLHEIQLPQVDECKGPILDSQQQPTSPSATFSERQKKWKEELDEELARKREMKRQAGAGGNTSSPKDKIINKQRERLRFAFTSR